MLDVCTIEDLVICGTFELLTIHVWLIWAMTCIITLDVHACMSERNTHTHIYIYHNMYSFTWFYNILHASLSIFYIHILYVIHNKYRSSAPASAAGLGAKHCTPSQRCRWWHQLLGISVFFVGNHRDILWEYIYMYICIYPYEIIYSMYICIMKWLFNVFMGLNDHINICICLIIWLCMYICNVIWDISCFMYIWLYMICIPGYYLKICNMSLGYVTVRIHSAALGHLCRGDEPCTEMRWIWSHRTAQTVADSLEKYGESAF